MGERGLDALVMWAKALASAKAAGRLRARGRRGQARELLRLAETYRAAARHLDDMDRARGRDLRLDLRAYWARWTT